MSVMMVCPRHYTLRTTTGHVIKFEPNTPKAVPDDVVSEAMAVNIIPAENNGFLEEPADTDRKMIKVNITGLLKDALVLHVIDDLVRENEPSSFDGGGRPKLAIINERTGLSVSSQERLQYWERYRTTKAAGEELPKHKALEPVLEIQYLSTPKDVREYAIAMDLDESAILGRSVREQKQILLNHVLKKH